MAKRTNYIRGSIADNDGGVILEGDALQGAPKLRG